MWQTIYEMWWSFNKKGNIWKIMYHAINIQKSLDEVLFNANNVNLTIRAYVSSEILVQPVLSGTIPWRVPPNVIVSHMIIKFKFYFGQDSYHLNMNVTVYFYQHYADWCKTWGSIKSEGFTKEWEGCENAFWALLSVKNIYASANFQTCSVDSFCCRGQNNLNLKYNSFIQSLSFQPFSQY